MAGGGESPCSVSVASGGDLVFKNELVKIDLRSKRKTPTTLPLNPVDLFDFNDPLLPRQWHLVFLKF